MGQCGRNTGILRSCLSFTEQGYQTDLGAILLSLGTNNGITYDAGVIGNRRIRLATRVGPLFVVIPRTSACSGTTAADGSAGGLAVQ